MQRFTNDQLKRQAAVFSGKNAIWHVHFLTPGCQLNNTAEYITVLECPSEQFVGGYFQNNADKSLVGELTRLLHGVNIRANTKNLQASTSAISEDARRIIERAKQLNDTNVTWHHHMLFPDCQFNSHQPKWTLMLEDPETNEVVESLTDEEPKDDLTQLEPLFYAQTRRNND